MPLTALTLLAAIVLPGYLPHTPILLHIRVEQIAREILPLLSTPPVDNNDLPRWRRRSTAIQTAADWPRPEFRTPLLALLASTDAQDVKLAAWGLLYYHDPALRDRVAELRNDERSTHYGCMARPLADHINAALDAVALEPTPVPPCARALVPRTGDGGPEEDELDYDALPFRTIPEAIRGLFAPELNCRVQAYIWLREPASIVLTGAPLLEAWPLLTEGERNSVLSEITYLHWGNDVLHDTLTTLIERYPPDKYHPVVQETILAVAARHRVAAARDFAIRVLNGPPPDPDDIYGRHHYACDVIARTATRADFKLGVEWLRSSESWRVEGGAQVLANLDDPSAAALVLTYISGGFAREPSSYPASDLLQFLQDREWQNDTVRWMYIDGLLQIAHDDLARLRGPRDKPCDTLSRLIDALCSATGVALGDNGVRVPAGITDVAAVRQTLANYETWAAENHP